MDLRYTKSMKNNPTYDRQGLGFAEMAILALNYPRAFKRFEKLLERAGDVALYVIRGFLNKRGGK